MPSFHYRVELRNKSGALLEFLESDVLDLWWKHDFIGGCGEAYMALRREFDDYGDIKEDYDVQIRRVAPPAPLPPGVALPAQLPIKLAGEQWLEELRWRGTIIGIEPTYAENEFVALRCHGYRRLLEKIAVANVTRSSEDVAAAARYIIDTYVVPGSQIKRTAALDLVQDTGKVISSIGVTYDTYAHNVLEDLAKIGGNAEWGVRPDNEIYFLPRSNSVKQTHDISQNVSLFVPETDSNPVIRKVFIRGKSGFTATVTSSLGDEANYNRHAIIGNPALANAGDATLWATAYFDVHEAVQPRGQLVFLESDLWIENRTDIAGISMPPLGKLRVTGGPVFIIAGGRLAGQFPFKLAGASGGSTDKSFTPHSIRYRPTGNALQIEVDLGEEGSELGDLIGWIQHRLESVRQLAA